MNRSVDIIKMGESSTNIFCDEVVPIFSAMKIWRILLLKSARSLDGIGVDARDIEGCQRLPLSRNSRGHNKKAIVMFVNQKYAEALLKDKK